MIAQYLGYDVGLNRFVHSTEIADARGGQPTLLSALNQRFHLVSGAPVNIGMNGYRFTGCGDAQTANEFATLGQVTAAVANAGVDPVHLQWLIGNTS